MQLRIILAILNISSMVACNQIESNNRNVTKARETADLDSKSLDIINGVYRGTEYTDSLDIIYNLRYMPVLMKNNSNTPIELFISFKNGYAFSDTSDEVFNILPLPTAWAVDGSEISEDMIHELPNHVRPPSMQKMIASNDSILFALAVMYKRGKSGGLIPTELFLNKAMADEPDCQALNPLEYKAAKVDELSLKININGTCFLIPCGTVKTINEK